ncbi:MAG: hypothetical protein NVSMB22_08960 [Chloroflexota bacterium]
MGEMTDRQCLRLEVLRYYNAYVEAMRDAHPDMKTDTVREARRDLAHAIESACTRDSELLEDFRRAFAARPQT